MIVLVDVDGVQADLVSRFLRALYSLTGRRYTPEQWIDWSPVKSGLCTADEAAQIFDVLGDSIALLPDIPGAQDGIRRLRKAGHRVVALTSPLVTPGWLHGRMTWLQKRGFGNEDIVLAWDKSLVHGDVLVEDNAENANAWAAAHPEGVGVVLAQPWNANVPLVRGVERVDSWAEIH